MSRRFTWNPPQEGSDIYVGTGGTVVFEDCTSSGEMLGHEACIPSGSSQKLKCSTGSSTGNAVVFKACLMPCTQFDCSSICDWASCSVFSELKAQCEFTGSCLVSSQKVGLEAAEITGIVCCALLICVLLASYYRRKQHPSKSKNAPVPTLMIHDQALLAVAAMSAPVAAVSAPAPVADPTDTILKLKGLLDAGAITQDEFDIKKANQLAQM